MSNFKMNDKVKFGVGTSGKPIGCYDGIMVDRRVMTVVDTTSTGGLVVQADPPFLAHPFMEEEDCSLLKIEPEHIQYLEPAGDAVDNPDWRI